MTNRWHLNRVGLLNFWYYTKETFELANGHMILRGTNGSGKSLTMQSLFPVLFDGDTSAYRLDSFGSRDRKMEDYLLGEKGVSNRDEGIGYLFLEVKKEEREEYLSIGIGMHANRGGSLKKWFFALENNQRIDQDFFLYEELRKGEYTPLTKKKLKNRLEGKGRIFDSQRDYKAYVNQRIFGFDHLDQFDELISLLIQLRSPKLSKDFRPSVIYGILRNSLPKLKDEDLLTLSKTIEQLDLHRERLEDLSNEIKELDRFAKNYNRWYDELVAQVAGKWQLLSKSKEKLAAEVTGGNEQLTQSNQRLADEEKAYTENDQELETLAITINQLHQHEGMNLVSEGLRLKQSLQKEADSLQRTKASLNRKQEQLKNEQDELEQSSIFQQRSATELEEFIADNQQYLPYLRLEELDAVYNEKLRQTISSQERRYWLDQVRQKQVHFRKVKDLLSRIQALVGQIAILERQLGDLQQQYDKIRFELSDWQKIREDEIEKWKLALDEWQKQAAFQLSEESYHELLYRIDGLLEEEEREEVVLEPLTLACQQALQDQQTALVPLKNQLQQNQKEITLLEAEVKEWQEQKIPEPPRAENRQFNRKKWNREAEYTLFYQAVDFQEQVSEEERDRIEGALLASGILDAVISQDQLSLADDIQIQADPQLFSQTLNQVLKVNNDLSDILQVQVADVLASIYYGEKGAADLPYISSQGSYQIANLQGEMAENYQASFIGVASQERYRQSQIARLQDEISQVEEENRSLDREIDRQKQQIAAIEQAYQLRPRGTEVYQSFRKIQETRLSLAAKQTEVDRQSAAIDQSQEERRSLQRQLADLTAEDHLGLNEESYEDALQYAENYEQNLRDAFDKSNELQMQQQVVARLQRHVDDYQQEETDLLYDADQAQAEVNRFNRLLKENQEQQEILNVAELKAKLSAVVEEQNQRKQNSKKMNTAIRQLNKEIAQIASKLVYKKENLSQLEKQEINWRTLLEKELQRFGLPSDALTEVAKEQGKEINIKELKRLEDRVTNNFNFLADQLQSYQPKLVTVSGVSLSEEEENELGEFASFNNYNEPFFSVDGQNTRTSDLLDRLKDQQLTLRQLLKKDDEQLFKRIILESVGKVLRIRIQQAQQWVAQMNQLLQEQKNSSGLSLSIGWKGISAMSEEDLSTNQLVALLQKPTELLSEEDRESVSRHFQAKVALAQEQLQENEEDRGTLFQAIATVLDYRDWFEFELKYRRANEGYQAQPLTDRRFNQFSGGEKAIAMYLPLFAATYSRYQDAGEFCPRVITLDEAFAGIDDQNIAELFKACEQLGFNYIMNSQSLFGDYPTVSKLAIYELLRPQNVNFVTTIHYLWDGRQKHLLTGGE